MIRNSAVLLTLLAATTAWAGQGRNIALGKPYTMTRPSYRLCTDAGDKTQLTDGVTTKGYFWTQKTTVGWGKGAPVFITIDLGAVHAIGGLSFGTAAGVAGVHWPTALMVFVSDDGTRWFPAGDLVELSDSGPSPPEGKFAPHVFRTRRLRTRGRYVQLACVPTGPFLFVDEIEVYEGEAPLLTRPHTGQPIADVPQRVDTLQLTRLLKAQLRRDLAAVTEDIDALAVKGDLPERAAILWRRIDDLAPVPPEGFRAVLPMTALERDIFRCQAAVWRAQKKPLLRIWKTHRWDPLAPSQEPADATSPALSIAAMRGEWRSDTLNLTNAGDSPLHVRIAIEGLPGGTNPPYVTIRKVEHVGTRHFVSVAAALPPATRDDKGWLLDVPSGMTRQVWVSVHPTDAPAGTYVGSVVVQDGARVSARVPLSLRIFPMRFPDQTALQLGGWSYTNVERGRGVTPENREALVALLREYGVNTPWATKQALPTGGYNAAGNLVKPPDTANFDAWVKQWPGAQRYLVFLAVGDYNSLDSAFAGSEVGTPLFAKKVGAWSQFWAGHMRKLGLKPSQLGLLLVDEPNRKEQYDVTVAWAKAIKATAPGIVIWVDAVPKELETCRAMLEAVDMLVPNRSQWQQKDAAYRRLFLQQRQRGCALGFYSCAGPARRFDPYSYYLVQQWHVFAIGGSWAGFWAFSDDGGASCWNEYVAKGNGPYCPLYLDATSATPAKYLEAIREGAQDYEALAMLRSRIGEVEQLKQDTPLIGKAKALLEGACERVLGAEGAAAYGWDIPKDRAVADRVRIEVLEMLVALGAR
ncbi:hypothetical protein HQ560_06745 [bacterium]|nr:hypothetical protein [bacterium]